VGAASRNISVRLDEDALSALRVLSVDGLSQSEIIRQSLMDAARRRLGRAALAAEAEAAASDPDDRAEMLDILAHMDELRGPW